MEPIGTQIAEYSATASALAVLRQEYGTVVFDVSTKKGMDAAKDARARIRKYRTSLESVRKQIKGPALERCRLIDAEAKEITAQLLEIEKPIADVIDAEEARIKAEQKAAEEAAANRAKEIQARIDAFNVAVATCVGANSDSVEAALLRMEAVEITVDLFGDRIAEAVEAREVAIGKLRGMLEERQELEMARAMAEAAKQKAEQEERDRRKTELDRLEAERATLERECEALRAESALLTPDVTENPSEPSEPDSPDIRTIADRLAGGSEGIVPPTEIGGPGHYTAIPPGMQEFAVTADVSVTLDDDYDDIAAIVSMLAHDIVAGNMTLESGLVAAYRMGKEAA